MNSVRWWMAWLVVAACFGLAGCSLEKYEAVMPITTSSEEAREIYLEGLERAEHLHAVEARRLFERAVELDADFALAHLALAETAPTIAQQLDSLRRAISLKGGVTEGESRQILAFEAGMKGDSLEQTKNYRAVATFYPDDKRALARYGAHLITVRQCDVAIEHLGSAVRLDPEYAWAHATLGAAYRCMGQLSPAREAVDRYLELRPDEPAAHAALGDLLMKAGQFEESNASYEKALSLDVRFVPAHVGMGTNHVFLGDFAGAREAFGKIAEAASNEVERRAEPLWTAVSYIHEGRHDQALAELERRHTMAEQAGDVVGVWENLNLTGDVLLDAGRYVEASTHYAKAHDAIKAGGLPFAIVSEAKREHAYRKVRVALALEDVQASRLELAKFLRLAADEKSQLWTTRRLELRGLLSFLVSDVEKAIKVLPRANPRDPRLVYFGALARIRAGDLESARDLLLKVAEFNEVDVELAFVRGKAMDKLVDL